MKKKALLALAALTLSFPAWAFIQPLRINFQGKLIDPSTNLPRNGSFTMCFGIYPAPTGGTCASAPYNETQSNIIVTNGVFSVQIGTVTALNRELFLGASAYLGVTVTGGPNGADSGEMLPRQSLVMSPYAFTANQLSDQNEVRLIAGPSYSTFTSAGNLTLPAGIAASSAVITNWITASSATLSASGTGTFGLTVSSGILMQGGTLDVNGAGGITNQYGIVSATGMFTATGGAQYSLTTSSGINMLNGTLHINGGGGIDNAYGIITTTIDLNGLSVDPVPANQGMFYYNSSSNTMKMYNGAQWQFMYPTSPISMAMTVSSNGPTAVKAAATTVLVTPLTLSGPMTVNKMTLRVTTLLAAVGDMAVYNSTGGLVLNGAATFTTAVGIKTVTPLETGPARWLPPGQYYVGVTWNGTTGIIGGAGFFAAGAVPRCGTTTATVAGTMPTSIVPANIVDGIYCYFFVLSN